MDLSHLTQRLERSGWTGSRPASKENEPLLEAFDWMGPDSLGEPASQGLPPSIAQALGRQSR